MNILEILKPGFFVSGEDMARSLKISRAAVHKQIARLRKAGYNIDGAQNLGYKLLSRPDLVNPEAINHYLKKNGVIAHSVFCFPETTSTQDEAKKIAETPIQFPALVIAERQTASYGRLRRQWVADEGGLWFSLVLKPVLEPDRIPQITFAASLAVCRAVEAAFGLNPGIKWPNDVLFKGKKFAGILTEMSAEVGKLNWVIVGIGINANNSIPEALKDTAISLSEASGEKINRAEFLSTVLSEFYGLYDIFIEKGFAGFQKEYNQKSMLIGAEVSVDTGTEVIKGTAQKIDASGYIWLKTAEGKATKIIAGDVIKVNPKSQ
jgi:BirA family transcriptional regulator, biotin operon repressor / biotin---[acetyl-CoA-carboxylase] ligase